MATEAIGSLTLQVEPCPEDFTRYRWVVREGGHTVRVALYALPDAGSAEAQGRAALAEVAAIRRDTRAAWMDGAVHEDDVPARRRGPGRPIPAGASGAGAASRARRP
ncbi:hypothetical protein [Methylobacterium sp. J-068]|uniref:hypothetical protein n=1 Tax=Methylobacterium sp. J-068 TaxID=2836649 RepID=UPI001FB99D5A|nr:hypothetical protein [Methylobacterium sp. J-068]MCJ2033229.1 hypothetical protein [Methylobacterium sp. J-068]